MVKVSICTITYNHAPYIAQAIESVLMQRGPDLEVEMVIGDDVSSDDTRAIVADYARRYPESIKPLFHEKNLGPGGNTRACLAACTGEFVAALEGDDYWTDPDKLRLQVAALRSRPDCALCFHDAGEFEQGSGEAPLPFSRRFANLRSLRTEATFTQADIARDGWFMPTASLFWRREALPQPLPLWWLRIFSGDYTLQVLIMQHGAAVYLPRVMSAYRIHPTSLMRTSQNTPEKNERRIFENELYKKLLPAGMHNLADSLLEYLYFERSEMLGAQGRRAAQFYYYGKAMSVNRQRLAFHLKRLARRATGGPAAPAFETPAGTARP